MIALARRRHPFGPHARTRDIRHDGRSAPLRQRLVTRSVPLAIGVPFDDHAQVGVIGERLDQRLQHRRRFGAQSIAVAVEQDAAGGHLAAGVQRRVQIVETDGDDDLAQVGGKPRVGRELKLDGVFYTQIWSWQQGTP